MSARVTPSHFAANKRPHTFDNVDDVAADDSDGFDAEMTLCDEISSHELTVPDVEATREEIAGELTAEELYVDPTPLSCLPLRSDVNTAEMAARDVAALRELIRRGSRDQ